MALKVEAVDLDGMVERLLLQCVAVQGGNGGRAKMERREKRVDTHRPHESCLYLSAPASKQAHRHCASQLQQWHLK